MSSFGILVYIPSLLQFSAPDKIKHIIYLFSNKKLEKSRLVVCKTRFYLLLLHFFSELVLPPIVVQNSIPHVLTQPALKRTPPETLQPGQDLTPNTPRWPPLDTSLIDVKTSGMVYVKLKLLTRPSQPHSSIYYSVSDETT